MLSPSRTIIAPGLAALCTAAVVAAPTLSHAPVAPAAQALPVSLTSIEGAISDAAIEANHVLKDIFLYPEEFLRWAITDLAEWVVGLPSYIINSQISLVYELVEQLIREPLFGFIDGVTGYGPFGEELLNGITGMGQAFVNFGKGEVGFFGGLFNVPLPHFEGSNDLPPGYDAHSGAAVAASAAAVDPASAGTGDTSDAGPALTADAGAGDEHLSLLDLHPGDLLGTDGLSLSDFGADLFNGSIFSDLAADLGSALASVF